MDYLWELCRRECLINSACVAIHAYNATDAGSCGHTKVDADGAVRCMTCDMTTFWASGERKYDNALCHAAHTCLEATKTK